MKKEELVKELEKFNGNEIAEQTLLTWIQSGLTMIGFGFGLGSVIALMRSEHYEHIVIRMIQFVAVLLIVVGVISILLAIAQHRHKIKQIEKERYRQKPPFNLALIIGILIVILGVIAFVAILTHVII